MVEVLPRLSRLESASSEACRELSNVASETPMTLGRGDLGILTSILVSATSEKIIEIRFFLSRISLPRLSRVDEVPSTFSTDSLSDAFREDSRRSI